MSGLSWGMADPAPTTETIQISACLKGLITAQDVYFVNNGRYTRHDNLLGTLLGNDICEGVTLVTFTDFSLESDYFITGRIGDTAYNATPDSGITAALPPANVQQQVETCLNEIAVSQELHLIDYGVYTNYKNLATLFNELANVCSGVALTERQGNAEGYDYIGRIEACVFRTAELENVRIYPPAPFVPLNARCDETSGETGGGSSINPNPDMQIRNGRTLEAESIISGSIEPLRYGTFKRGQAVMLEFLIRNPGQQILDIGELGLPSFLSNAGAALPETLGSFESVVLSLTVDTSTAGQFTGQVSLESNDPDAFENPFVFDVVISISDEPANALYVLPGANVADVVVSAGQTDVPLLSFYVSVPAGSVPVTVDSFTLAANEAVASASELRLYIDGGARGVLDSRDVLLSRTANTQELMFNFEARTFLPETPMWFLLVGNF